MPPAPGEDLVGLRFGYVGADETVRARFKPHLRLVVGEGAQGLLVGFLAALFTFLLPFYLESGAGQTDEWVFPAYSTVVLFSAVLIVLERTGRALIDVLFTEYIVTDHRVYSTTAFVRREVKVVPFEKVTNLVVRQGLAGRILGVAEVRVVAYGARGTTLRLRGIRDPVPLYLGLAQDIRTHTNVDSFLSSD